MKLAAQPRLPSDSNPQLKIMSEGATPKHTISDMLSNSAPKALCEFVNLAIRPSKPSQIPAMTIAQPASLKLPDIPAMIA